MKLLSIISISLFSGICCAQHGGVQLQVLDEKTHCRYEKVQLIASQDSIVYDTLLTDDKANAQFLELPVGKVNFSVREFGVEIAQFTLTVQLYQLLTTTVYIREKGQTGNLYFGNQGTPVAGNGQPENQFLIDRSDLQNYYKLS